MDEIRWIDWVFLGGEIIAAFWAFGTFRAWLKDRPEIWITGDIKFGWLNPSATSTVSLDDIVLKGIRLVVYHTGGERALSFFRLWIYRGHRWFSSAASKVSRKID